MAREQRHTEQPNRGRDVRREKTNRKKGKNNLKIAFAITVFSVAAIVSVSAGVILKIGKNMYANARYVADEDVKIVEEIPEEIQEETVAAEERQGTKVSKKELKKIQKEMKNTENVEVKESQEIYNVLLAGVDRRDKTWNGNSDSMILVSIDRDKNKVTMTSLMRDTYVDIPEIGYQKLNAAYAYGAGPLLCTTVTDNFKVKVDRYAAVDFFDLIDIIDCIGGVTLEVSDAEAEVANGYITDMCNLMNIDAAPHLFPGGGTFYCDGVQAVGFARNRYVGNSDFERTQRQRYVISQLMAEVKQMSLAQMTEKMQTILGYVTMNIPEKEIWEMLTELPDILDYQFEMERIPYDNMYDIIYVNKQDMLVPYWDETITELHNAIYGA